MSEGPSSSSGSNLSTTRVVGTAAAPTAGTHYSPEQLGRVKADLLETQIPESVGGYRIRALLGTGGMGTVYEAEQAHPHRIVALKVIHSWAVSPSALRRFEVEAEALARLEHPYVARIYSVGADANGAPFLAMERVKGGPLSAIPGRKLSARERLDLLARICDGVHYAHQRGVIHRDLKPSNIMVDDEGRPRILDFGVARLTDSDVRATTTSSREVLVGTLPYMSPEQLGAGGDLDIRSDVYSLGVIGYELLTGQLPLAVQDKPIGEAARIIRETEPKRPSTFDKALRGDVDAILMKALAKDPAQRYPSAATMADDIRRSLSYEPVTARRLTSSYQLGRFVLRNPLFTSLVLAVLFALVAGLSGTGYWLLKSHRLQHEAEGHLEDARNATLAATEQARQAQLQLAKGLVAQGGALDLAGMHADARARFTEAAERLTKVGASAAPADAAWLSSCQQSPPPLVSLDVCRGAPLYAAFDATGSRAQWVDPAGTFHLTDLRTGRVIQSIAPPRQVPISAVLLCGDSLMGVTPTGLVSYRPPNGEELKLDPQPSGVVSITCSDEGRLLLVADGEDRLLLYDLRSRKLIRAFQGAHNKVTSLALSPDGALAVSGGHERGTISESVTLKLWNASTGSEIKSWAGHTRDVTGLRFLPGGDIVSCSLDQTIRRWDLKGDLKHDQPVATFAGHAGGVTCLAVSPDGQSLLSGSGDQTVRLWDLKTTREIRRFEAHHGIVTSVAFSPDGRFGLSSGNDGVLNAWDLAGFDVRPIAGDDVRCDVAGLSDDGRSIAAKMGNRVEVWDVASGRALSSFNTGSSTHCIAVAPDGARILVGGDDGWIGLWSSNASKPLWRASAGRKITCVAFAGQGTQVVVARDDGKISVRSASSGDELRTLSDEQLGVTSLAVSRDGKMLLSGSFDHTVRLWDLAQGRVIFRLEGHLKSVNCVAFSPDSKRALSGSADQTLRLWDLDSGHQLEAFAGHGTTVVACAFSPDGRWALSAGEDGAMRTWDLVDRGPVGMLPRDERNDKILVIGTAGDGWRAVSDSLRLWDFSRAARFRQWEAAVAAARDRLATQPDDANSLQTLDQWFAFRGRPDWARPMPSQSK